LGADVDYALLPFLGTYVGGDIAPYTHVDGRAARLGDSSSAWRFRGEGGVYVRAEPIELRAFAGYEHMSVSYKGASSSVESGPFQDARLKDGWLTFGVLVGLYF